MSGEERFRIFGSPRLYVQGPGALGRLSELVGRLGSRPALVTDGDVARLLGARLTAALGVAGEGLEPLILTGAVTTPAVAELARAAAGADVVVAAGGGRALDAGKAVALRLGARLVMLPTIASADAATSRGAVVHEADGRLAVEQLAWNPDVVLVDTALIAAAPARFLRWGIGDALATRFEMVACVAAGSLTPQGGLPTLAAMALAEAAYDTVRRDARPALDAVEAGTPNAALEAVVEAALLLSGIGFEGGGLSIAHSVAVALTHTPGADRAAHGEHAAYGLLVQLALEDSDAELLDIAGFAAGIGLPVTLGELGADAVDDAALAALAARVMAAPWPANHPRHPDADDLLGALRRVERLELAARHRRAVPLAG